MISRYDIGYIRTGQKAEVASGNVYYSGTVEKISPVAENDSSGKPKVRVEVSLDEKRVIPTIGLLDDEDEDRDPTIGLEAEVTIFAGEADAAYSISEKALYTDDEGDYVYVLSDSHVEKRRVVRGVSGNDRVEITEGIGADDLIITSPLTDEDVGKKYNADQ